MKWHRIYALVIRYVLSWIGNIHNFVDDIMWPILDIILWGMTGMWMQENQEGISTSILTLLGCLVFWYVVQRANDAVSMTVLEELWERNLINIFSTPLTIFEWMTSLVILSFFRIFYTLLICVFTVWILYACNVLTTGWLLLPFFFLIVAFRSFYWIFYHRFYSLLGQKSSLFFMDIKLGIFTI